ncbi:MAG: hypothetical protein PHD10_03445 [Bacilli bacterium]|nr:hypothetical protein [Bacilli bacterium]
MKCSKCGSPLIPGEDFCKICGEKVVVKQEPEIEIIDFGSADTEEVIDFVQTEVELNRDVISNQEELIINEPVIEEVTLEIPQEEPVAEETIEEVVNSNEPSIQPLDEVLIEDNNQVEEVIIDNETPIKEDGKVLVKTKKESKPFSLVMILIMILLIVSIGLNVYLVISDSNKKANKEDILLKNDPILEEPINKEIVYNSYLLNLNSNWKYEVDDINDLLFIYDNSENWGLSVQVVEEVNYNLLVNNKEDFIVAMKKYDLLFTSDYEKTVNNKEMYLYKGKYGDYTTYLILTKVSDKVVGISKLMFQGEVDDKVLDNVLNMTSSITEQEFTSLKNNKFSFNDLSKPLIEESKKIETKVKEGNE